MKMTFRNLRSAASCSPTGTCTSAANPTYLPESLAGDYDCLWTEERMQAVIAKAVKKGW